MAAVDLWIVFDTTQYRHKSWINRNRIIHPNESIDWQYISIPVRRSTKREQIRDVQIGRVPEWNDRISRKLSIYQQVAPHFDCTMEFVESLLGIDTKHLSKVVIRTLTSTAEKLGISTKILCASEIANFPASASHPGEWGLEISKLVGADTYINPISGRFLFQPQDFQDAGIQLKFFEPELPIYSQSKRTFVEKLSIVDVMMFNDFDTISNWTRKGNTVS